MCVSPDGRSQHDFLNELKNRVARRRREDGRKSNHGRPDIDYRNNAALCYACSVNDKHDYVGYSGGAGGMSERGGTFRIDKQALRRISRLEDAGINPKNKSLMNRPRCHCAEAAALSIAVSYGETLESLMFFAFDTEGKLMRPCSNCLSWLSGAAGYWDDYIKCNNSCGDGKPKRKRDDGDGDDSNKRRKVINAGS